MMFDLSDCCQFGSEILFRAGQSYKILALLFLLINMRRYQLLIYSLSQASNVHLACPSRMILLPAEHPQAQCNHQGAGQIVFSFSCEDRL